MPNGRTDDWKKRLRRGDIISVVVPGDLNGNKDRKYRPAIVIKNNFDQNLPIQTLDVQMLTTLSNWKDVEKGENIGESFTWNNRKQYMQGVHLKKISYGIVYGIYYGYNQDRRKETRFEDDHTAMQLIKKLYNVSEDKDWDNLVPTAVLWTSEEQQQQQKYLNQ